MGNDKASDGISPPTKNTYNKRLGVFFFSKFALINWRQKILAGIYESIYRS